MVFFRIFQTHIVEFLKHIFQGLYFANTSCRKFLNLLKTRFLRHFARNLFFLKILPGNLKKKIQGHLKGFRSKYRQGHSSYEMLIKMYFSKDFPVTCCRLFTEYFSSTLFRNYFLAKNLGCLKEWFPRTPRHESCISSEKKTDRGFKKNSWIN